MKNILVILTGGTIGSLVTNDEMDVSEESSYQLISYYQKAYGKEEVFEVQQPFSVLSEDITPMVWEKLCITMSRIPFDNYQGVIVTHGSDTLAYTSAMLGMLLGYASIPVVLTASNHPLGEEGSNGLRNFRAAVELICSGVEGGVYTVYEQGDGQMNVHLATRLTEADAYMDQFGSFGGVPYGRMESGKFIPYKSEINPNMEELKNAEGLIKRGYPVFHNKVLMIRPYPGFSYDFLDLSNKPAAIIHYLYHSATACTQEGEYSLLKFLEKCRQRDIPVYTASYKSTSGRAYVTAKKVIEAGAIPMENISAEAAYMKLLLLYNFGVEEVEKQIKTTLYFENVKML